MSALTLVLAPLLGLDNMVAAAGIAYARRNRLTWVFTCLTFGAFAGLAVQVGVAIGAAMAVNLAAGGRLVAALIIATLGLRTLWPGSDDSAASAPPRISPLSIMVLGLALSADTVAASIALGAGRAAQHALPVIAFGTLTMSSLGIAVGANATRISLSYSWVPGTILVVAAVGIAAGWM